MIFKAFATDEVCSFLCSKKANPIDARYSALTPHRCYLIVRVATQNKSAKTGGGESSSRLPFGFQTLWAVSRNINKDQIHALCTSTMDVNGSSFSCVVFHRFGFR
jgi:hypothetical protein